MASVAEAVRTGLDHYFSGRRVEAAIIFDRILEVEPDQPESLGMAGILAGESGDTPRALRLLEAAARRRPENADFHRNLARMARASGDEGGAWKAEAHILPIHPADPAALTAMAENARLVGAKETAHAWLRRVARLTLDTRALTILAELSAELGRRDDATALHRQVVSIGPALDRAWGRLSECTGRGDEATAAAERAIKLAPREPRHHLTRHRALVAAGGAAGASTRHHGNEGQDALIHSLFFPDRRCGVFVDLGAYDGVTWSNTLFFERELGWTGWCVEASPARHAEYLASGRSAPCANVAVGDRDGEAAFLEVTEGMLMTNGLVDAFAPEQLAYVEREAGAQRIITVPIRRLNGLLAEWGAGAIDLLCLDVEGAEFSILADHNFARFPVEVICVENQSGDPALPALLSARGYAFVHRFGGGDEIYARDGWRNRVG